MRINMELILYPNDVLTKPCAEVKNFADIPVILDEMHTILGKDLGLACNQVGHSLRIFLLRTKNEVVEIINPVVLEESGEQYETEGCLSFKSIGVKIKRPYQIDFTYQDRNGILKSAIVYGMEAVCFAHEFDHLNGVTILEKVNRQERKRILKELKK